jgi:hypothetical protein
MSENLVRTTIGEMLRYIGMWLLMSCYMKPPEYIWRPATRMTMIAGDDSEDEKNDTSSFTASFFGHHIGASVQGVDATDLP